MDPEGIETFEAGGGKYTAVFGFRAMKQVETHFDLPFIQAIIKAMPTATLGDLDDQEKVHAAAANLRFTDLGILFAAALVKHHPDLTEDDIDDLIDDLGLTRATEIIGRTVGAALVQEGDAGSTGNPRKPSRPKR